MSSKFYAVRKGKTPGIYYTWADCKAQVEGYSCAEYKSFKTLEEADAFMMNGQSAGSAQGSADTVIAYVDGSYNQATGEFSYGMIVLRDGEELKYAEKYNDKELATMHNVAGEIKGSEAAMRYAYENGLDSIVIYHDYAGISKWCLGEWKTNKDGTRAYKAYYDSLKDTINIRFEKVTGHSNDKYNDIADELAKQALGIIEHKHDITQ